MKHILLYYHARNLLSNNQWKPFIDNYFEQFKFLGFSSGSYYPEISISNWEEIKNNLPKSYKPLLAVTEDELKLITEKYSSLSEYYSYLSEKMIEPIHKE